jgi:hypothetical protein
MPTLEQFANARAVADRLARISSEISSLRFVLWMMLLAMIFHWWPPVLDRFLGFFK